MVVSKIRLPCGMSMVQYEGGWQCIDGKLIAPPPKPTAIDYGMGYSKKGRPSPRTQGVTAEGETFQKFGTQQLEFVAPVVYGTPYQGVVQKDVGRTFKMFTTAPFQAVKGLLGLDTGTVFSQRILAGQTGATPVGASYVPPPATPNGNGNGIEKHGCECEACKNGTGECSDKRACCDAWDIPCELFGCPKPKLCECENCKKGIGECSDKVPACNAWDIGCEITGGKPLIPESTWFWVKIILVLVGIGILLWLLRPLFGIVKNITD